MIVWINGAFGAGKTTLSEELERRVPDAMMFDPEYVGSILRRWVPPAESGDFQDIPAWRTLTAEFALTLRADYQRPLIVPMTLVNPVYQEEIFGRLRKAGERIVHVFLEVPAEELHRRIDAQVLTDDPEFNAAASAFRHRNVERCVAARADLPADTLVLRSDLHTPAELAGRVLEAMNG
jgi:AAA domain